MVRSFLWSVILLLILAVSCDVIEGNVNEFVPNPGDTTNDTTGGEFDFRNRVLLIEFTGHKCGNCPAAAEVAADMKDLYKSRLAVVAAHVGVLALPRPANPENKFIRDFRCQVGNDLDAEYGASISGIPWGVINNSEFNGNALVKHNNWPSVFNTLFQEDSSNVGIAADFSIDQDKITGILKCKFKEADSRLFRLGAFVTEDSIIDWQTDYRLPSGQQDIENYLHEHALIGNFYPDGNAGSLPWGYPVNLTPAISAGQEFNQTQVFEIPSGHVQKHLNMVVFVSDNTTKEILAVREYHLKDFLP